MLIHPSIHPLLLRGRRWPERDPVTVPWSQKMSCNVTYVVVVIDCNPSQGAGSGHELNAFQLAPHSRGPESVVSEIPYGSHQHSAMRQLQRGLRARARVMARSRCSCDSVGRLYPRSLGGSIDLVIRHSARDERKCNFDYSAMVWHHGWNCVEWMQIDAWKYAAVKMHSPRVAWMAMLGIRKYILAITIWMPSLSELWCRMPAL
jgi:hypothetical protein